MKFSLINLSALALLSLAVSASPLEKRTDATPNATAPAVATTSDSMHGAKATASISIIGSAPSSSDGNTLSSYASMSVIIPAAIAAAWSLA